MTYVTHPIWIRGCVLFEIADIVIYMTSSTDTNKVLLTGYRHHVMRQGIVAGTVVLVNDKARLTYTNQTYAELVETRDNLAEITNVNSKTMAGKALKRILFEVANFDMLVANQIAGRAEREAARAAQA